MTSTGQRNSRAHGLAGRRGSALAPLLHWRDWSIPVKLAAVMLVPVIVAIALGFVVIDGQIRTASTYDDANRVTGLSSSVRTAVTALENERLQAAMPSPDGPGPAWIAVRKQADLALARVSSGVNTGVADGDLDSVAQSAWSGMQRQLSELPSVRAKQTADAADPTGDVGVYTQLIGGLLAFDRVLISDLNDATMTREAMAIYDVFSAREEISYQQSVVLAGMGSGTMSVDAVTDLHGSEARYQSRINDFRSIADPAEGSSFDQMATASSFAQQSSLLGQAIDQSGGMSGMVSDGMRITVPVTDWNSANSTVLGGLTKAVDDLVGELQNTSASLQDQASSAAGAASTVLFLALLLAVAIMAIIARQLLRSIGVLRRTARDVATRTLPEAVERIRLGEAADVTVAPVPVHTTDEVGQLARAFDAMQTEAVKLAVEQANLRGNYSDLFVNLSRRSQSLVQRQLRLIEQLERDEEDPDQLSALFKLDHLATRMRRNNENLMVLSGSELGRGPSQAVPLADLLRAAVSEIEQYQRVVVQPPPGVLVLGYAAGDLIRLIAELLDNATAFSAPETPVTIASHRTRSNAVVVDIVDHGIGMSDEDLARANERLAQPEGFEGRLAKRLGLFVVSRLAGQHGVRVRLHGGHDIPGLRVTVTAPARLVLTDPDELSGPPELTAGPVAELPAGPSAAADPVASALTVTIPQLPSSANSGVDLFAPIGEDPAEDGAEIELPSAVAAAVIPAAPERERDRLSETTPIFDDMLSAWFHDASPDTVQGVQPVGRTETAAPVAATPVAAPAQVDEPAEDGEDESWRFAADDGWRAVDAVTQSTPESYTTAGLPKRQPKARLLPGSVAPEPQHRRTGPAIAPPGETAEQVRARLAGFQQGIRRGRDVTAPAGEAGASDPATRPEPAVVDAVESPEQSAAPTAAPDGSQPGSSNGQVNGRANGKRRGDNHPAGRRQSESNGHRAGAPGQNGRAVGNSTRNGRAAGEPGRDGRPATESGANGRPIAEPSRNGRADAAKGRDNRPADPDQDARHDAETRSGTAEARSGQAESRSDDAETPYGAEAWTNVADARSQSAETRSDNADTASFAAGPRSTGTEARLDGAETRPGGREAAAEADSRGRTAEESGPNGRTPGESGPHGRPNGRTPGAPGFNGRTPDEPGRNGREPGSNGRKPGEPGSNGRGSRGGDSGPGGTLMFAPVDPGPGRAWPTGTPDGRPTATPANGSQATDEPSTNARSDRAAAPAGAQNWQSAGTRDDSAGGPSTGAAALPQREPRRTVEFGRAGSGTRRPEAGRHTEPGRPGQNRPDNSRPENSRGSTARPERQAEAAIWPSAADVGWQAVDEVSRAEPETYTAAGLPKRQPRARLLPGSVVASELPSPSGRGGLDANAVRDRLNSFQRGVHRGRTGTGAGHPGGVDAVAVGDRRHEPGEHGFQWENE